MRNAGGARFRPILLTSLTTFGGILPTMFEKSTQAQFVIPMGISLAGRPLCHFHHAHPRADQLSDSGGCEVCPQSILALAVWALSGSLSRHRFSVIACRTSDIGRVKPIFILTTSFALTSIAEEKLHSATKPVPRSGGWTKRHESFNKRVAQGNCDLIFIGDSITQGWEGRAGAGQALRKTKCREPRHRRRPHPHVIWRLDNGNLHRIKPKAAVIMIGTNNSGSNTSQEIADGVEVIVKQLRKKLPDTKALLGVFPRGANNADKRRQVNEGTNAIFKKFADGSHYLDIGPKFLEKDGTLSREIMPDLLHLSEKGYTIWAESIEAKLKELMGE